jgi:hypothetical protein
LFSRNIVAVRNAAGGGEVLFLVEEQGAHAGGGGGHAEEEAKADDSENQGDADVSGCLIRRLLSSTCFRFKGFSAHAAFPLPQVAKWVCAMLTNFRTMTVDRCHNRFVALFWFRCFGAQVVS